MRTPPILGLLVLLLVTLEFDSVEAWSRSKARRVIVLSEGQIQPESVTTDGKGKFYSSLYNPTGTGSGELIVWTSKLKPTTLTLSGGPSKGLTGVHYRKTQKDLLVVDNVQAIIYSVNPSTGVATQFAAIPLVKGQAKFTNDLTEDSLGNVYITDSLQGVIFTTGPTGGTVSVWSQDSVLSANGLGVNGLAFSKNFDFLYVSNTAGNAVYSFPILSGFVAGTPTKFASSFGPDGVRIDADGNVWVAANVGCEIDVFNSNGLAIDVKGDFEGLDKDDVPVGLIGPAGLIFDGVNGWYVVNAGFSGLGLFDTYSGEASRYVISRVTSKISKKLSSPC